MALALRSALPLVLHTGRGILIAACLIYGVFALFAGFGLVEADKLRAAPVAFRIHAVTGAICLVSGALQIIPRLRRSSPGFHRVSGRAYGSAAILASLSGIASTPGFDVGLLAQVSFIVAAVLWLGATLTAWREIRRGRRQSHAAWMTRSFALALFFLSFSLWVPLIASIPALADHAYPIGVTLAWALNLMLAEGLIRRSQPARA